MISAILLSAGLSERFGSPKALAKINETTRVIETVQRTLLASPINEIIVVLGAFAADIKPFLLKEKRIKSVLNKNYREGQISSFQVGLKRVSSSAQGVLLWPVDYPAVKLNTIEILCDQFLNNDSLKIIIPSFKDHKVHPPIFPIHLKEEFLELDHSQGLNIVAQRHQNITTIYPVDDPGVIKTFNTPEEFEQLKKTLV